MNLSKTTGWLLVIGVIGGMALGFSNETASADWTNDAAMLAALSTNVDWTKLSLMLSAIAQVFIVIGIVGIRDAMSGGVGHKYASMAIWFLAIGATTNLLWSAMMGLTGDQWSSSIAAKAAAGELAKAGNAAGAQVAADGAGIAAGIALSAWATSVALGATTNLTMWTGITLLGIGLTMQKSLHMILAALIAILGIFGIVQSIIDARATLIIIPWIGTFVIMLIIGLGTLGVPVLKKLA
ncbi:MAG: hypothetical protein FI681_01725 [SAR202 cluster bacterium]|nr:hypothetical protein [SAR202 cluster bacterium]